MIYEYFTFSMISLTSKYKKCLILLQDRKCIFSIKLITAHSYYPRYCK